MSTRSLPIGWGQRGNASDPDVKSERPGDWREMDLASKYKRDGVEEGDEGGKVPLGFGSRSNMKTLEELSLSGSASEVAVAEVNLKNMPKSGLTYGDLEYVKPYSPVYTSSETSRTAPAAAPAPVPASASAPAPTPTPPVADSSSLLIQAVLQMDSRMKEMQMTMDSRMQGLESNVELILARLDALSKQGGK